MKAGDAMDADVPVGTSRIALARRLRRIIDDGSGSGLALEGISAAEMGRAPSPTHEHHHRRTQGRFSHTERNRP